MDNKDRINQILHHIASVASTAADGVSGAVQQAGNAVSSKYDEAKLTMEIRRHQDEQNKLFADIGRTLSMIKSGIFDEDSKDQQVIDAQQTIDKLLLLTDQKQQEIDFAVQRLNKLNGAKLCPVCGKISTSSDPYCPACGTRMPEDNTQK